MRKRTRVGEASSSKYLFVLPGIIWVLTFTVFPLLYSLRLTFYASSFGRLTRFVGLGNFERMLGDYRFWNALKVTGLFTAASVCGTVLIGLGLAVLFNRKIRGVRLLRGIFTTPMFTAPVALGYMSLMIFYEENGPINLLVRSMGFQQIPWLSDAKWALISIILVDVWQWTPFAFLVLLAGLQSQPEEVYEAAVLDSSSGWQIFRHVTLPLLSPVLTTVVLLRTVEALKVFDLPFSLTSGGPGIATRTLSFYVYTQGLRNLDLGYASAMAYALLVMVLIVSLIFFRRLRHLWEVTS